jgi:hypothetical protein
MSIGHNEKVRPDIAMMNDPFTCRVLATLRAFFQRTDFPRSEVGKKAVH